MRNLDSLLAAKSRLREWLFRSARTLGQASLIALALSAPVWAQDDVTITTPTTLTGDDDPLNARILTISSNTADNASLSLIVGGGTLPAAAQSRATIVGSLSGEIGSLSITQGSQLNTYGNYDDLGEVAGHTIYSGCGYLGLETGSHGSASISGPGSLWSVEKEMYVGYAGEGTLTIDNGGRVTSTYAVAGYLEGSDGTINLSGPSTVWNNNLNMYVGWSGHGRLEVSNGAYLNTNGTSYVGILTTGSGNATIDGLGSTWNNNNSSLVVGHRTLGELNILNGAYVQNGFSTVGSQLGGMGIVNVSGLGSTWRCSNTITVGNETSGVLNISNQSQVDVTNDIYVGFRHGGNGTVTVTDSGSLLSASSTIVIGYGYEHGNSSGQLSLSGGGAAISNAGIIGLGQNASGAVEVSGNGSNWAVNGTLSVGEGGLGSLNVLSGGSVTAQNVFAGLSSTAHGQVSVSGTNSQLVANGDMLVGYQGQASMTISSGGTTQVLGTTLVGLETGGDGLVSVAGATSLLDSKGSFLFGLNGTGRLEVSNGGTVLSGFSRLGNASGASGHATVSGQGSNWTTSNNIELGASGHGSLTVSSGGLVQSRIGHIGLETGGSGVARISGANSIWTIDHQFTVGYLGTGSVLVEDGGRLNTGADGTSTLLGAFGNAQIDIDGAGSNWTHGGDMFVAEGGNAQLSIRDGGSVSAERSVFLGTAAGSQGALSIAGAGSKLSAGVWAFAGLRGSSNLEITNGGELESYLFMSAAEAGSLSQMSVRGANSRLVAWDQYHGNLGNAALSIEDGGEVRANNSMTVGRFAGAQSSVNVSGIGSKLSTTNDLSVGYEGQGNITVENGGLLQFGFLGLGGNTSGLGSVHLTGLGSRGEGLPGIFPGLAVGAFGNGELRISNQAELAVGNSYLGLYSGSGSAVVESGGKWANTGDFFVGNEGSGQLEVLSGGKLITNTGAIARLQQSSGSVLVSGAGSEWNHTSSLSVGLDGTGSLTVINGGKVANGAGGYIGFGGPGVGSVSVFNAGSSWSSGAELVVGLFGNGALAIADGGQVLSTNGYVAARGGSSGVVSVLGAGSTWNTGSNLFVGGDDGGRGGEATLVVGSGGLLTGSQTLVNYDLVEVGVGGTVDFNHVNNFGTLVNNGMIDASLTLHSGSIASGNGTVTGLLSVNDGGILAPGNSVGLMSAGDVDFNGGGAFELEFLDASGMIGTGWDGLDLSGSLTVNATSGNPFLISVSSLAGFSGFSATSNYSWEFITADGGIIGFDAGSFTIDASGFAGGAYSDRFWLGSGGNSLRLNFTAVPEPGTLLPLGLVAFGLLARSRKRAKVVA